MSESTETIPPKIAAALAKAQWLVKPVEKTSTNAAYRGSKYASAESVISAAREALQGAGLALVTIGWRVDRSDDGDRMVARYVLVLAEDGSTWALPDHPTPIVGGDSARPADKAEATALTYGLSYALRGLLLMARVAEGTDADQRDDDDHAPPTFEAALAACKTPDAVRKMLWRHRERIGEEVSRETGTPLILAACERVKLTPAAAAKAIASIWGESGASSPDGAPSGDRD